MNIDKICHIEEINDRLTLVLSKTYINPISYLPSIEEKLIASSRNGKVVFDLLLTNGNAFNRFVETVITNGVIDRKTMKVINIAELDIDVLDRVASYYRQNKSLIESNQILFDDEKSRYLQLSN
jgi:hypothetical protein